MTDAFLSGIAHLKSEIAATESDYYAGRIEGWEHAERFGKLKHEVELLAAGQANAVAATPVVTPETPTDKPTTKHPPVWESGDIDITDILSDLGA